MRYETFPDAEAVVSWVLREADIEGLGDRVYSSIPNTPTYPLIVVRRIGGVPAEIHHLDRARIQIDVWGEPATGGKGQAHDIAADARVAVLEAEGQRIASPPAPIGAFVTSVEDDLGLMFQPDPNTGRDRYLFGVSVYLHD